VPTVGVHTPGRCTFCRTPPRIAPASRPRPHPALHPGRILPAAAPRPASRDDNLLHIWPINVQARDLPSTPGHVTYLQRLLAIQSTPAPDLPDPLSMEGRGFTPMALHPHPARGCTPPRITVASRRRPHPTLLSCSPDLPHARA
jgi:hypothetical protein